MPSLPLLRRHRRQKQQEKNILSSNLPSSRYLQPHQRDNIVIFLYVIFFLLLLLWVSLQTSILKIHLSRISSLLPLQYKYAKQHSSLSEVYKPIQNMTFSEAQLYIIAPVTNSTIDTSQYTIRMNTWHRNEQLLISINHHAKCEGVASIQIVWCDQVNEPPEEILRHEKVKIERHEINSLNERFRILLPTPTLGILSLDDDVLRSCEALDAAFIRWTRNPTRIVGFDPRSHKLDKKLVNPKNESESSAAPWEYGMVGTSNLYSITLPSKSCFLHRDYVDLYTAVLPRPIYQHIDKHFQCEDIAMSYFVSALTEGKPPLLSDYWASSSLELYTRDGISGQDGHIGSRHVCVNDFAEYLGLKEGEKSKESGARIHPLQRGTLLQDSFFRYGDEPESWASVEPLSLSATRLQKLVKELQWRELLSGEGIMKNTKWAQELRSETELDAKKAGLIIGTIEWKHRFRFNCVTEFIFFEQETNKCFATTSAAGNVSSFVCDITEGVMHHVGDSTDWMVAGPAKGTGAHEYAAFVGDPPCKKIGRCHGCSTPRGTRVCSVKIDPEDCSMDLSNMNHMSQNRSFYR